MRIDANEAMRKLKAHMQRAELEEERGYSRRGFMGSVLAGGAALGLVPGVAQPESSFPAPPPLPAPVADGAAADDERYWDLVARQFFLRPGLAYMNTGTRGPSPAPIHMAQVRALHAINTDYSGYGKSTYTAERRDAMRAKLAEFVGAKPNEIAYSLNTSDGMVAGTFGPVLSAGDEIVYTNHDHSGGAYPVLHRAMHDDLEVGVIDLSDPKFHPPENPQAILDAFESAITSRTKLLSFCHVNYTDGCVLPVKEICEMARSKGILTIVDGAQPPGMMKLDMHELGCDMYAGPFHKWVLASMQTGFFFCARGGSRSCKESFHHRSRRRTLDVRDSRIRGADEDAQDGGCVRVSWLAQHPGSRLDGCRDRLPQHVDAGRCRGARSVPGPAGPPRAAGDRGGRGDDVRLTVSGVRARGLQGSGCADERAQRHHVGAAQHLYPQRDP